MINSREDRNSTMSKTTVEKAAKDSKKEFYRKRKSRITPINSASNQRALAFQQADSVNWLTDKKSTKPAKIQKIKDTEEFMLQVNPQNKFLTMLELIEKTMIYGTEKYYQALFEAQVAKGNTSACELKRRPYVRRWQDPGVLDLTGFAVVNRPAAVEAHAYNRKKYDDETTVLLDNRVKIIGRIMQTLEPNIRSQVEARFPDWMENPNIIAVMDFIDEVFNIAHFSGRREEFTQQVEEVMSSIYIGEVAYQNYVKNGAEFDLAYHKRLFDQALVFRRSTKLIPYTEQEKAKRFLMSCSSIRHLKPYINRIKSNELEFEKLPYNTPEEIEAADTMRLLPRTVEEVYRKLDAEVDTGVVYKDDLKDIIKQSMSSQYHV